MSESSADRFQTQQYTISHVQSSTCTPQELVKAHGGEIWVESQETRGSSFTFLLPLVRDNTTPRSTANVPAYETYESTMKGLGGGAVNSLPGNGPGSNGNTGPRNRLASIKALDSGRGERTAEATERTSSALAHQSLDNGATGPAAAAAGSSLVESRTPIAGQIPPGGRYTAGERFLITNRLAQVNQHTLVLLK